jgi:hypothetical protein
VGDAKMKMDEKILKAWAFDNKISLERIERCWQNALDKGNFVIKNLHEHGHDWTLLPIHLLEQLIERYDPDRTGCNWT